MSRTIFNLRDPQRIIIGTIGQPGQREFYLQIKISGQNFSFALEKSQAAALGQRCQAILREIGASEGEVVMDRLALDTPVESEFTIGVMSLLWEAATERFLLEAQAIANTNPTELNDAIDEVIYEEIIDDSLPGAPPILRTRFDSKLARGFVLRTEEVVAAGRPPCIFCGTPINPDGHLCPRANGYRRQV